MPNKPKSKLSDVDKLVIENPGDGARAAMDKVRLTNKLRDLYAKNRAIDEKLAVQEDLADLAEKEAALLEKNRTIDKEIEAKRALEAEKEGALLAKHSAMDETPAQEQHEKQQEVPIQSDAKVSPATVTNNPITTFKPYQPQPTQNKIITHNDPKKAISSLMELGKKGMMLFFLKNLMDTFIQGIKKMLSASPKSESGNQKKNLSSQGSSRDPREQISALQKMQQNFKNTLTANKEELRQRHEARATKKGGERSHEVTPRPR